MISTAPLIPSAHVLAPQAIVASLSPEELTHFSILWNAFVPQGEQFVQAHTGRELLERSGLPVAVLHQIWELADDQGKGALGWENFVGAMRLVAFAQTGVGPIAENMFAPAPPGLPNLDIGALSPAADEPIHDPWAITKEDRQEYIKVFNRYDRDRIGLVDAKDAREIFSTSDLPRETLFHIWDLVDRQKRGKLDLGEFVVASHLIVTAGLSGQVPSSLPPSLATEFDLPELSDEELDAATITPIESRISPQKRHYSIDNDIPATKNDYGEIVTEINPLQTKAATSNRMKNMIEVSTSRGGQDTFDFRSRTRPAFAASVNPSALISAVVEGDRSMAEYLKERSDTAGEDLVDLQNLKDALVADLKDQREELNHQLQRYHTIDDEVHQLRSQYTQLYALRREVLEQTNSIAGQSKILSVEKDFLERAISEIKTDISHSTSFSGDLEQASKTANAAISSMGGSRQAVAEMLKILDANYQSKETEVGELEVALKRLEGEKARLDNQNARQLEGLRQGLSDHAAMSLATEKDNRTLQTSAHQVPINRTDLHKTSFLASAPRPPMAPNGYVASRCIPGTSPQRPVMSRDAKGIPHSTMPTMSGTTFPTNTEQWVTFRSN